MVLTCIIRFHLTHLQRCIKGHNLRRFSVGSRVDVVQRYPVDTDKHLERVEPQVNLESDAPVFPDVRFPRTMPPLSGTSFRAMGEV